MDATKSSQTLFKGKAKAIGSYGIGFFFLFFGPYLNSYNFGQYMVDFSYMYDTRHWLPPTYVCTGPILSRFKEMSEHVDHPFPCSDKYGRHKTDCHLRIETIITKKFVSSNLLSCQFASFLFFL